MSKTEKEMFHEVFGFLKKWLRPAKIKNKKAGKIDKVSKNESIKKAARALDAALSRIRYADEVDESIFYNFIRPMLWKIDNLYGNRIYEQIEHDEQK